MWVGEERLLRNCHIAFLRLVQSGNFENYGIFALVVPRPSRALVMTPIQTAPTQAQSAAKAAEPQLVAARAAAAQAKKEATVLLMDAISRGDLEMVKAALAAGAYIDAQGEVGLWKFGECAQGDS